MIMMAQEGGGFPRGYLSLDPLQADPETKIQGWAVYLGDTGTRRKMKDEEWREEKAVQ